MWPQTHITFTSKKAIFGDLGVIEDMHTDAIHGQIVTYLSIEALSNPEAIMRAGLLPPGVPRGTGREAM